MTVANTRVLNIRDIARLAGVSHQTVSRVVNDVSTVRPATRQRVLDVIHEHGFRPNETARALSTNRSRTIGVLSAPLTQHGPVTSVYALEVAARSAGYRVSLTSVETEDESSIKQGVAYLMSQSVEALVVVAPQRSVLNLIGSLSISVPFITLQATGHDPVHGLSVDQIVGARIATRHLIDLGHTRIAHVSGPQDWLEAEARLTGFQLEMAKSNLTVDTALEGDWSAESGYWIGRQLLESGTPPTAAFVANDQMAVGFIHACADLGLTVPADISVIGFDDVPEAAHFAPPLTTVRQDFAEVARLAVIQLLAELGEGGRDKSSPVVPRLIVRASTSRPAHLE